MHPAKLSVDALLAECTTKRTKGSGPGGQHRNKVESAIVLEHVPTKIRAEASERRNQHENHRVAVRRLRIQLALRFRTSRTDHDVSAISETELWRNRAKNGQLTVSAGSAEFPALLADVLDVLEYHQGSLSAAAKSVEITTSQLIKFIKLDSSVWQHVNESRRSCGFKAIR